MTCKLHIARFSSMWHVNLYWMALWQDKTKQTKTRKERLGCIKYSSAAQVILTIIPSWLQRIFVFLRFRVEFYKFQAIWSCCVGLQSFECHGAGGLTCRKRVREKLWRATYLERCSRRRSCSPLHCGWPAELLLRSGCFCEPVKNRVRLWLERENIFVASEAISSTTLTPSLTYKSPSCSDRRLSSLLQPLEMCKSSYPSAKALTNTFIMGFK